MIHHTKLLVRRLAYTPWLLVAGLVLGWTGMAVAQDVNGLTVLDKTEAEDVATGTMDFTVILSVPMDEAVTVDYRVSSTSDNTASIGVDYTAVPGTLTILATEQTGTISISITNDDLYEEDETFTLTLSNAKTVADTPESVNLVDAIATGTITDDDTAPVLSVADLAADEGEPINFVVTLTASDATTLAATVAYSAKDNANDPALVTDAKVGTDYTMESGTLTFTVGGPTTQTVTVETIENTNDVDANLTFTLELSSPVNATFATITDETETATGTITDDDDATNLTVSVDDATGSENSVMQFPVTLSGTSYQPVTVPYSTTNGTATGGAVGTADIDFVEPVSGAQLVIAAGQTTGTIYVVILEDNMVEDEETFTLTLGTPTNAIASTTDGTATGTISSQQPSLSVSGESVDEADEELDFTISLSAETTEDVTVKYRTVDGSATGGDEGDAGIDYVSTSGMATITAGMTSTTVSVAIVDDEEEEGVESFSLTLSSPDNATLADADASAMGTINPSDAPLPLPTLSVSDAASVVEGETAMFPVTVTGERTGEVTFSYEISIEADDSAEPADFENFMAGSGTMPIPADATSVMVSVKTEDDTVIDEERSETFTLTLSSPTNATLADEDASAKGSITDNDVVSVSVSSVGPVVEGETAMFTVTLSAATIEAVTVQYRTVDGTATAGEDYTAASGMATITAGATSAMVSVATIDDADEEGSEPEIFTLTLSDPSNAVLGDMSSAQGAITDNDLPSLSVSDASAVEGEDVEFAVTLSKPSTADQAFSYGISIEADDTATPDDFVDFMGGSGTVTIAAGTTEATVSVATVDDAEVEGSEPETFTLTVGGETAKGRITDNDLPSLSVSDASAVEGEDVEFAVMLSVVTDEAVTVKYATSIEEDDTATQADFRETSGTLTIAAGATEATVSVETIDDAEEEAVEPETFTLTLSDPSNAELSATMSSAQGAITDNESPTPSVSDASAVEGEDVEFTVTLSKTSDVAVVLPYGISIEADDTATQADFVDFVGGSGTLTIAAGATEATVSVETIDDNSVEEDETFTLTVGGVTAKGTITDNDVRVPPPTGAITLTVSPASVREDAGTTTEVSVTASVDSPTAAAVTVSLVLSGTATEGTDYTVSGTQSITISAGATLDKTTLTFTPINDAAYEGDETILITGTGTGYTSGSTRVTLIDDDEPSTPVSSGGGGGSPPPPPPPPPFFDDKTIAAQFYIQGTAIDPLVFPIAQDGTKPLTYGLSQTSTAQAAIDPLTGLPDSLAFDPKTRTLTGTPATPLPATEFSYTVIDADGRTASLCFDITIYALIGPPTPPTDLTVALDADGKLVLHWKEPARNGGYDLTSYEVQYQKTTSASWRSLAIRVAANHPTKTYTIGSLQADAEYNVRVRAYNLNPLPELSRGEWAMASTDETAMPDEIAAGTGEPAADGAVCKPGVGDLLAIEDAGDGEPSGDGDGDGGEPTVPSALGAPANLTATPGDGKLLLRWKEPTQTGGFDLTFYDLQYQKTTSTSWISVAIRIPANHPIKTYSIGSLQNGVAYNVRVRVHNLNPDPELSLSAWTTATATPTEDAAAKQAASFELAATYPNPFNPSTTIGYALPQAADVRLDIYNVMGQRVRTLVAAHQPAGYYAVEWKATDDSGHTLSSGVYFYHLQAGAFRATKRMLLMR